MPKTLYDVYAVFTNEFDGPGYTFKPFEFRFTFLHKQIFFPRNTSKTNIEFHFCYQSIPRNVNRKLRVAVKR